jgi:hypothetical protein
MTSRRAKPSIAVTHLPLHLVVTTWRAYSAITVAHLALVDGLYLSACLILRDAAFTYQSFYHSVGLGVADFDDIGL